VRELKPFRDGKLKVIGACYNLYDVTSLLAARHC
jgi:hypothetical protein